MATRFDPTDRPLNWAGQGGKRVLPMAMIALLGLAAWLPATARGVRVATVMRIEPATIAREGRNVVVQGREWRGAVDLARRLRSLSAAFPGRVGVAVTRVGSGEVVGVRADQLFPQQSVSKLWVAMAVLDEADRKRVDLDEQVRIGPGDLTVFNQPLRRRILAEGAIAEPVAALLEQALVHSDNTANDSLLRHIGGPARVRSFLRARHLGAIRFGPGERLLQSQISGLRWSQRLAVGDRFKAKRNTLSLAMRRRALDRYLNDPVDGASPAAIVRALGRLAEGRLLSPWSTGWLIGQLGRTASGPNRLKGGAPRGWRVLHKTGTGQTLGPLATGYNDVGLLIAPDGARYAVAVMMAQTSVSIPARMRFMHAVTRAVTNQHVRFEGLRIVTNKHVP